MPKSDSTSIPQATRYQNAALKYYLGLTGSPFLHYGYWEPLPLLDKELTISDLRVAQEAYAQKLLSFIPSEIKTILDVGCGIGGNAAYLLERGFVVEGLAPDPFQKELFLKATNGLATFHLSNFEDFKANHSYDLVFLSESSQYISSIDIARGASKLLLDGGYLLLADMMRSDPSYKEGIFSNCHAISELQAALERSGFSLIKTEDISAQIAPTIDLSIDIFQRFGLNTIEYIANLIQIAVPPLYKLLRWMYRRWLKQSIVEGLEARKIFDRHLCYQIQLWHLPKPNHQN